MHIGKNKNTKDLNLHSHMSTIFYETLSVILKVLPINEIFDLTHCGRVTQYGDGSMLCKNPIFSLWKNYLKFKILWFLK